MSRSTLPSSKPASREGGELDLAVVHRTAVVEGRREAEHGAVELGGDLDVVDDHVEVGDRLHVALRRNSGHPRCPPGSGRSILS
jgi:hypothetical protein